MNTLELKTFLQRFKNTNVVSSNELPENFKLPLGLVINLSKNYEPGSHWVGLFINKNKQGYYMDSFGKPPIESIKKFIDENCDYFEYNKVRLQQYHSNVCGKYAALFICSCFRDINFYHSFNKNPFINDFNVNKFYEILK